MDTSSLSTRLSDLLRLRLPNLWHKLVDLLRRRGIKLTPWRKIGVAVFLWLSLVRFLRWRRYNAIHRKYLAKWNNGKGNITPEEAQVVAHVSIYYDMPLLMNYGFAFALFKTYGIPSISKLLVATKQLGSKETISRRYADTEILISTWFTCPISGFVDPEAAEKNKALGKDAQPAEDPRAMIALARTNWLHSQYNISNDDFLYTLSLFALEPMVWARKYGWRRLSDLEEHCLYVYWAEIGKRMNIKDIPETLEGLREWSKQYEEKYMVPAQSNHDTAVYTVEELLSAAPKAFGIKRFGEKIVICLMEDIVREAMMYPKQPWIYHAITNTILHTTSFAQRWLLPPRISKALLVDTKLRTNFRDGERPSMFPSRWQPKPWYKPESSGPGYYRDRMLLALGLYNEMPGPHLKSSGYRLEEMGPFKFENSGHEEIMRNAAQLQGCPINGPWSLKYN